MHHIEMYETIKLGLVIQFNLIYVTDGFEVEIIITLWILYWILRHIQCSL